MTGGFDGFVQSRAGAITRHSSRGAEAGRRRQPAPGTGRCDHQLFASVPQIRIDLDREKAKLLGVNVAEVFETLQSTFGALYVNDSIAPGACSACICSRRRSSARTRRHPQRLRADRQRRADPADGAGGDPRSDRPEIIERYNVFPSAKVSADGARLQLGQALEIMRNSRPRNCRRLRTRVDWHVIPGESHVAPRRQSSWSACSWCCSCSRRSTSGGRCRSRSSSPCRLRCSAHSSQCFCAPGERHLLSDRSRDAGGLASKNAILIVEFATMKVQEGMSVVDAAIEGARLRFRPIVMTSLAFILGVTPLAVSSGRVPRAGTRSAPA